MVRVTSSPILTPSPVLTLTLAPTPVLTCSSSYPAPFSLPLKEYIRETYGPVYYGKCQNLSRSLTRAYDAVLAQYDVLLMPTLPIKPTPLLEHGSNATGEVWV